jgi:hypothetical protein
MPDAGEPDAGWRVAGRVSLLNVGHRPCPYNRHNHLQTEDAMHEKAAQVDVAGAWHREGQGLSALPVHAELPVHDPQRPEFVRRLEDSFNPDIWTCAVCGKVRLRELLHSKAILGRQKLVCAPSCLGAERRANAR